MTDLAINDKGDALFYDGGAWKPAQVAMNDKGERMAFNGSEWTSLGTAAPPRPMVEQGARMGGQFAQNANDAIAGTVGAPVDLVAAGLRHVGMPVGPNPIGGSESIKSGIDYVATAPGRIRDAISQGSFGPMTEDRSSRFAPENLAEKIAAGVGQGAGAAASMILPAGAIAKAATPGTMTQGLAQTMASQPVLQGASSVIGGATAGATDNPMLGLAAALATPVGASAARRVITPTPSRLNVNEQRLAQIAEAEGVPLTPSQKTGSPTLRGLEETMAKLPLSAGPMQDTYAGQREALNKAIMSRTGTTAADASPPTMDKAFQTLGTKFDDLASRTTVTADPTFSADVQKAAQDYGRRLDSNVAPVFKSYMDDLAPLVQAANTPGANPQVAGDVYKNIRSDMARTIRTTPNPDLKRALGGLVEAFDGAMERSTSGALRKEWGDARKEYAALMTVDKAMSGGTQADRSAANIPLGAFANAVKAGDKAGYARERGQYGELAKLSDFLAPRIPDSGTSGRGLMASLLTGGAIGGPVAGAGGFTPGAMATGAAAAITPYAVSKIYNTPAMQAYLSNQVAAGRTEFAPLLAGEAGRRAIEMSDEKGGLARAMLRANEKRQGAAR